MTSFQFSRVPVIHFGKGFIAMLPELIMKFGKNVLVVTGKTSFSSSVAAEKLFESLEAKGISHDLYSISGEPSPEDVDKAVQEFRDKSFNVVAAIGGGSAIDCGKAVSAMLGSLVPVESYLEGVGTLGHPGSKVPFIAVPTTSGTGSEATKNAVLSRTGKEGFKKSLRHDNFVPDIALVDPLLTVNCRPEITAASGLDCMTQLLEAYLSVKSTPYTDALALTGLRSVRDSLTAAYADGENTNARAGMSFAALTSGICLANAGLGVVHGFASSVGGNCDIPHGVICGTLMASANESIVRKIRKEKIQNEALGKYRVLGELFLDCGGKNSDYCIDSFIDYLHRITNELKLPGLKTAGVRQNQIKGICLTTECKNNPVTLSPAELEEILVSRFF